MQTCRTILFLFCASALSFGVSARVGNAADKPPVLRSAFVQNEGHGYLVVSDGNVSFKKGPPRGRTTWNIWFTKEGIRIVESETGRLLGIDAKTKKVKMFVEPGETTTWQVKQAGAKEIKPRRPFDALVIMKLGDEELRMSCDEMGRITLGGRADILQFYVDGP